MKELQILMSQLKDHEVRISESLAGGSAQDYASYREVCGSIRGLLLAQNLISDLVRNLEKDDDD
jgi:hypothetical protein